MMCNDSAIDFNDFKQIFEKVGEATETALVTLAEKINPYSVSKTGGCLEQAKVVKKDLDTKWKKDFTLAEKINPYSVSKTGGRLEQAKVVKKDLDTKWKKDFTLEFSRDRKSMSSYCTPKKPTRIGNGPKMF